MIIFGPTSRKTVIQFCGILLFFVILGTFVLETESSILGERFLRGLVSFFNSLSHGRSITPDNASSRLDDILIAWQIFIQNPIVGCGFLPPDLYRSKFALLPETLNHLFYMQLLVYTGLLGLSFYLPIILGIFVKLIKTVLKMKRDGGEKYLMGWTLISMYVGIIVKGFFDPLNYESWMIMALSGAFIRISQKSKENFQTA